MPKLKQKPEDKQLRILHANIVFLMTLHGMDQAKTAAVMGVSPTTFGKRMSDPGTISIAELQNLAAFFKIPAPAILTARKMETEGDTWKI